MDTGGFFALAAAASGGLLGALAFQMLYGFLHKCLQARWLAQRAGTGSGLRRLLAAGVPALKRPAAALLGFAFADRLFSRMQLLLEINGMNCSRESLCSSCLAGALALFAAGTLLGSWVAGLAFACCLFAGLSAWSNHAFEARRDALREALPDAVRAMSACFHAGFTLQQTFGQLESELSGPVSQLFGRAKDALDTGASAKQALEGIRSNGSVPELAFLAVALEVQHRAGGSMRHVLDAACESLESELALQRSLRVHTAQARLSARVVTGVTIALVGALSLMTENFLGPFFESPVGLAMLACAIAMQAGGVLMVRRMLKVEAD